MEMERFKNFTKTHKRQLKNIAIIVLELVVIILPVVMWIASSSMDEKTGAVENPTQEIILEQNDVVDLGEKETTVITNVNIGEVESAQNAKAGN